MESSGPTRTHAKSMSAVHDVTPTFPSKTDKPRPHICGICTRGFARLEHLKRHERSHTKEKPFACNECTRCFARRDLLLRHQQKLHMSVPPSSRRRRESASSTADSTSARVRKNSTASISSAPTSAQMRPRANTISHVDNSTLGPLATINSPSFPPNSGLSFGVPTMNGLPGVNQHYYRGMSSANGQHGNAHVLPKIETKGHQMDTSATLRTAPPYGNFAMDGTTDAAFYGGSTVNPAQLHFSPSSNGFGFDDPMSPMYQGYSNFMHPSDGDAWVNNFDHHMSFGDEHAIENSSPSAVDSASPAAMSEFMTDAPSNPTTSTDWHQSFLSQAPFGPYSMDASSHSIPDFRPLGPLSPKSVQMGGSDHFFSTPPPLPSNAPPATLPSQHFSLNEFAATAETPSNSTASVSSSNRQSSVTSVSTESVTEATRQALVNSLIENADKSTKKGKPSATNTSPSDSGATDDGSIIPPLQDLQRYIGAYLKYFHPHLPFFHVPTLTFDAPAFVDKLSLGEDSSGRKRVIGGGGSLILSICAIGALYERDLAASRVLFEKAKVLIQSYLQQHHQAETANASPPFSSAGDTDSQITPLWLVQAMLLNVVYGHNCGDKTTAGIASTRCAALVSLAREAHLVHPGQKTSIGEAGQKPPHSEEATDIHQSWEGYISHPAFEVEKQWHAWKAAEERKRTLYAIFILSSLLVSAYNSPPALMNSEISLDLPCDERLWGADSAEAWCVLGGVSAAQQSEASFPEALSSLLNASQRPRGQRRGSKPFDSTGMRLESLPEAESKPSTFGCLILINALHNYIWETRQHHAGQEWSQQDTERLYAHMEPALQAWQLLWSSHPDHSLERPNKFGATSLSADSIPLLDLAYVRLFVNLGKSKELFFQRDWDAMADEFASGAEIVQHAEHTPNGSPLMGQLSPMSGLDDDQGFIELDAEVLFSAPNGDSAKGKCSQKCSNRERQLRKAALCAANSLMMSDRLNVTFADFNSMELPLQSALCAFDCAQILAEWVSTLQQRVGPYLGILGQDPIHFDQAPACLILEEDDRKLLDKIKEILSSAQMKLSSTVTADKKMSDFEHGPFGSRILNIHARMFEKEAVWPVCCEMSQALQTQARHIQAKTTGSLTASA